MTNSKLHPLLLLSTAMILPFVISIFDSLTQSFADTIIEKGSSAAYAADQIYYSQGGWAAASIAFTVLFSAAGVWIARKILKKYMQPQEEDRYED